LAGLIAALLAVKVFLNSAVGLIGKLVPVLWVDSAVWQKWSFFSIHLAISADPAAENALPGTTRPSSMRAAM
jgi:hypothetical protein